MADMTEQELAQIAHQEFSNAELFTQEIEEERSDALDFYHSEPFGNEEAGLSQYVSSDVRDVVEWILPQVIDIFLSGDEPVRFTPIGKEDIKQAEQETAYVQHVFENKNESFLILYEWFKTALIQKNGVVECYWDDTETTEQETYRNQDYMAFQMLVDDEDFEIESMTIYADDQEFTEDEFTAYLEALDPGVVQLVLAEARADIDGVRKFKVSKPCVEGVAPENFYVNRDHGSLSLADARYTCRREAYTASELIEQGYDEDLVDRLPSHDEIEYDQETVNRFDKEGGKFFSSGGNIDRMRREIIVYKHFLYADFDGDGVAELRMIRTVGSGGEHVLDNERVDRNPFHALSPYPNPFKHYGRSVADNVESLQRVTSQLWRGLLDNIMYSVIPRKVISGNVEIDDLLTYVPGGVIRKDPNATIENENIPFVGEAVFPMLQQVENTRAERTGFSRDTAGLNPAALSNSTNLVGSMIMNQSQLLVKMIARIFAETGYKSLMVHMRELMHKYADKEDIFELHGEYVQTDPRTWRKSRDTEVRVGLGFTGKQEEISMLMEILALQEKIVAGQGGFDGPLLNSQNIYETMLRLTKRVGFKDGAKFFNDPKTYEAPAPQPSQGEIQLQIENKKVDLDKMKAEADNAMKAQEMKFEAEQKELDRQLKMQMHREEIISKEEMFERELIYKYGELSSRKFDALRKEKDDVQKERNADTRTAKRDGVSSENNR